MMKIKEVFYSIQGEGINTGRPAVFCRFVGCNLWSGREKDRAKAICQFCDTDFLHGTEYTEDQLVKRIVSEWRNTTSLDDVALGKSGGSPLVIFTGGEPGLQLTESLIHKMRVKNFDVAVETNGTVDLPEGVYHITVSPKAGTELKQKKGRELKVVWPQDGIDLDAMKKLEFDYYYLQPMDGKPGSIEETISTVLANPAWRLSLQTHKIIGVR
jgi:7-carboxy-7-deazaguanine synthase